MKSPLLNELINTLFNYYKLVIRLLLIIVFSVVNILTTQANDYYFSSSTGDDNRTTLQAQNASTPWRSIDKLNSIASQLQAGDRILFKSGDTFYGSILISRGGSSGNPIVYTSYGAGEKPVITSMIKVNNWVSRGNGTYEASLPNMDGGKIQIVTINKQLMEVGRYPNAGAKNGGYLTISSVNNSLSIQGENMPANFVGGDIVIRKNNWITDRHEISYNAGSTISFLSNSETGYTPNSGFGYFVQNHINTLDQFGEWAYSKSNKMIYGYFGGQDPNSLDVEVATREYLVKTNKYIQNLTFNNLNLRGANADIFNIQNSANVQITNCELVYAGQNAIFSHTTPDITVKGNTINYSLSGGLFFQFTTQRAIIEDNIINNTMPFQGMSNSSDLKGVGIYISGNADNSRIVRNKILNTGFNGIHFGGNYTVIKNNLINNFCLFKHDGAGIYTNSDGITWGNNTGREVVGNIILRGVGAVEGTTMKDPLAEGIYMDDNTDGVKILGNTISDVSGKGLYLHNAKNIEVQNNTFYKMPIQLHSGDDLTGGSVRNISISNNYFSKIFDEDLPYSISSTVNDIDQIGTSDNNYFLDPYGVEILFKSQSPNDGPIGRKWNMESWTNQYGYEKNSIRPDFNLEKYRVSSSNTIKESDFSSNLSIVAAVYNGSSELSTGIDGGVWKMNFNQTSNASAFIQIGAVAPGDEILIEFDTKSIIANQTVDLLLERTFNQNQEGTLFNFVTSTETKKVKLFLKSNVSASNESIVFRFPKTLPSILIDNLKISKVQTEPISIESYVFFEYNYSNQAVSYPLSGVYKNGKGEVFDGSVNIPAYGSVILAKIEDGAGQSNLPPTVSIVEPYENQQFIAGSEVFITVDASDPEDQIKHVEFFVNDKLVATTNQAPYKTSWKNVPVGNHRLKTRITDQEGLTAESTEATIQVIENLPPVANFVTPVQNQTFDLGEAILIQSYVVDPEGQIALVEFIDGNTVIGSITSGPYQLNWTNASEGIHELKTRVTDKGGLVTESSVVTIQVNGIASADFSLYLNAGSSETVSYEGREYVGDKSISPEYFNYPQVFTTESASSDELYQSGRRTDGFDQTLTYNIPVPNGTYKVSTHHIELQFGYTANGGPGNRIFDISIEGNTVKSGVDIMQEAGTGKLKYEFENIEVTDQVLTINLIDIKHRPIISGIAIEGANIVSSSPESVISYLPSSDITTETAITFTGAASTDNTGIVSYAWDFGDGTFSTEANPSHTFVSGGSFRVSLTVTDGDGLSDTESVLIDVFEPLPDSSADFSLYLNAGNGKTVNYEGKEYIGDRTTSLEYFNYPQVFSTESASSDELYQSGRRTDGFDQTLTYNIPVPNGIYRVSTHHIELQFGYTANGGPGNRIFDIAIEGSTMRRGVDIMQEAGSGKLKFEFDNIEVTDEMLTINLIGVKHRPIISGIAIEGANVVSSGSKKGSTKGSRLINNPTILASPMEGTGPLKVDFTGDLTGVDKGNLSYNYEFGDGSVSTEKNPSHLFVNPGSHEVKVTVRDGRELVSEEIITIQVNKSNEAGFNTDSGFGNSTVRMYPNPARDLVNLQSNDPEEKLGEISVFDVRGRLVQSYLPEMVENGNKYTISVSNLAAGVYFLTTTTEEGVSQLQRLIVVK